jgi:hypothetical protein
VTRRAISAGPWVAVKEEYVTQPGVVLVLKNGTTHWLGLADCACHVIHQILNSRVLS